MFMVKHCATITTPAASYISCLVCLLTASFFLVLDLISYCFAQPGPLPAANVASNGPCGAIDLETKLKVMTDYEGGKSVMVIAHQSDMSHPTMATILKNKNRRSCEKGLFHWM